MDLKKEVNILRDNKGMYHYFIENKLVREIFERYPKSDNLDEVLMKTSLLNAFYSTNVAMQLPLLDMAKHIVRLSKEENLDDLIFSGSQDAVTKIANLNGKIFWSFASKYCCNSNSTDAYYIYDSLVRRRVYEYFRDNKGVYERVTEKNLKADYAFYCRALEKYIELNNLKGTKREIDWYIWGKEKLRLYEEKKK